MSEDEDEEYVKKFNEEQVAEIPELINELEHGTEQGNLNRVKEILARFVLLDLFQQEIYLERVKSRTGIGIGTLRKVAKTEKENPDNKYRQEEDPFWLKIYNEMEILYKDKVKSMSDSRQLMLKRGNIYTTDIVKFTEDLSSIIDKYKTGYRNVRNDVLEKFRDSHLFDRKNFCYDPFIINFKNGYYDVRNYPKGFVKASDSKKIFFYEIPHKYKEGDYSCPNFLEALQKWLGVGNRVTPKDMFQFIGYSMSTNVGQKRAFLIKGETNSGKTQFQEILKHIIGNENTSEISLHMLGDDKFSASSLEWKILNVFDDLPQKGLTDVSLFKIIAGGGTTFPVRRMHTEPYQGLNTIKLWYNTNIVPMVKVTEDDSFFIRWIIIIFPNQFEKGSSDPKYEDIPEFYRTIINDDKEIQGIIHDCIRGLRVLYENKYFKKELSVDTRKIWEYESDLLYAFLDKYTELDDEEYILCSKFRKWYNVYRKTRHPSRKVPGVTATALNREMDVRSYERRQLGSKYEDGGKRAYMGLMFNKRFRIEKENDFKKKSYKTTSEYLEDNPNAFMNGNGRSEQQEDEEEVHWGHMDWNDKEKFESKLKKKKEDKDLK